MSFQDSSEEAFKAKEELDVGIGKDQRLKRKLDTAESAADEVIVCFRHTT